MFNVLGVFWVMILFYPFTRAISWIVTNYGPADPEVSVSYGLSLFHTIFNITNVCIMVWFVNFYVYACTKLIKPRKGSEEEGFQLTFISSAMLSTSELSLMQAKQEIAMYGDRSYKMFNMVRELFYEKSESNFVETYSRIEKYENISDRTEVEIANYLTQVSEGRLSSESKEEIRAMLRTVTEIESVADSCNNLARGIKRRNEGKSVFTEDQNLHFDHMMLLVDKALVRMNEVLHRQEVTPGDSLESYNIENEINNYRNQLKLKNLEDVNNKKYDYQDGVYYMDIIAECEKLGDYVINVIQAVVEKKF
jgi:phosphate:Na+ symporter